MCVKISRAERHRKGRCLCYQDRKKRVEKRRGRLWENNQGRKREEGSVR